MENKKSNHYDSKYYDWQKGMGAFGGWANITKFNDYISPNDDVLDFGCGGGYLLKNLVCKKRVGVEINHFAALDAKKNGIEVFSDADDIPENYVDIIISDNALEHTLSPFQELISLKSKLKSNGKVIFIVPCESIDYRYNQNDINHHLYSWSPMSIGNLFTEAGYHVLESRAYIHKWPPKQQLIARYGGRKLFEIACRIYGRIDRSWYQVKVVAEKQKSSQ